MSRFKIGVLSDGLRLGPEEGVKKSAELGAEGVQVYTTGGKMSPEEMTRDDRANFKAFVADQGIVIASLCGDIGGYGDAATSAQRVARSKLILDLAIDLGTDIVTTHIGTVPASRDEEAYGTMLAACREVAEYARRIGLVWATETGPEKGPVLKAFLDEVDSKGIGVNLDPANLIMSAGDDPVDAVRVLAPYIVSTHAKDGLQAASGQSPREVPLGAGDVDWDAYLDALEQIGFNGFLTIEREAGDDPSADIATAIQFLKGKV